MGNDKLPDPGNYTEWPWPNLLYGPASDCLRFLGDEMHIAGGTKRAIVSLENSRSLLLITADWMRQKGDNEMAGKAMELVSDTPDEWARNEREHDFPTIKRHCLIAMWGALEVGIEDTVVHMLINDQFALTGILSLGVKKLSGCENLTEQDARLLYRRAESKLHSLSYWDALQQLLASVGLNIFVESQHIAILGEINEVRNSLLHRGGLIDSRAINRVPSLALYVGKKYPISENFFVNSYSAISAVVVSLIKAVGEYTLSKRWLSESAG